MSAHVGARRPPLLRQVALMADRSIRQLMRRPAQIVPPLVFPLMLLAVNTGGLAAAPDIPNFPADSYLDFALVVTFMQGSTFATVISGLGLGRDIDEGFVNRLALTPMSGAALVLGQMMGAVAVGLISSTVYVAVGLIAGVEFAAGPLGVVVLVSLALGTTVTFAAIGAYLALRAGSAEAVQGLFPIFFAALFLSTMLMPRELMVADWFRFIATVNPVSYIIDGLRGLIISGWVWEKIAITILVLASAITVALYGCSRAVRTRLTRT